ILAPELHGTVLAGGRQGAERLAVGDGETRPVQAVHGLVESGQCGSDGRQRGRSGRLLGRPGQADAQRGGQEDGGAEALAVHESPPARGRRYLVSTRRTDLMITSCTGTFSWLPRSPVSTAAILSTTSMPSITLPKTA